MRNEIHPAVEAGAIAAEQKNRLKAKRKKAARSLIIRAAFGLAIVLTLWLFSSLGWIVLPLALVFEFAVMLWVAVWLGAWLQFRFAEGGLLDASLE